MKIEVIRSKTNAKNNKVPSEMKLKSKSYNFQFALENQFGVACGFDSQLNVWNIKKECQKYQNIIVHREFIVSFALSRENTFIVTGNLYKRFEKKLYGKILKKNIMIPICKTKGQFSDRKFDSIFNIWQTWQTHKTSNG